MIIVSEQKSFLLKSMKRMIKKYQLKASLSLRIKPMKEEPFKCIFDGSFFPLSVSGNNEVESDFQIINLKAIKSLFKSKKSTTN